MFLRKNTMCPKVAELMVNCKEDFRRKKYRLHFKTKGVDTLIENRNNAKGNKGWNCLLACTTNVVKLMLIWQCKDTRVVCWSLSWMFIYIYISGAHLYIFIHINFKHFSHSLLKREIRFFQLVKPVF